MRTVHSEPIAVVDMLASLGLKQQELADAIIVGETARDNCTPHHPPYAPGIYSHSDTVCALRDILVPKKWKADDTGNFSTVVEPDGNFAIAVATGDEHTGIVGSGKVPKTKYEKGARTLAAVEQTQLSFFVQNFKRRTKLPARATWFLLRRRLGDLLIAELSLPLAVKGNRIVDWSVRIILGTIHLDPIPGRNVPDIDGPSGADLDVPVTRRRSH